jgi:NAD(P)-dependent dehydrogenase (short-subunit alcohol dehydrogenase family)
MYNYKQMFDLSGKTALVAGAGSGIGEASAHGLAAHGAHVICGDLDDARAAMTAQSIQALGYSAESVALDIRDPAGIPAVVDILVSTPAMNVRKPLLDLSGDEFDRIIDLNLKGTFRLMQAVAGGMAERGRGSIITFASIRAQVVEPGQGIYAATKAGIVQMCRALAAELGPRGVRVNAIAPGIVETPLTAQIKKNVDWYEAYASKNALGRWAKPHEIAGAVVYLASDAASYVTGSLLFVDGGWTAIDGRFTPPL